MVKSKGKFLYSAVSSHQVRSERFTLYFPDRLVRSDTISASLGIIQPYATINARPLLYTYPPTSIARYSFIQLRELEQCRVKKLVQGFNAAEQDSNPGFRSRESETLPMSHCAGDIYFYCLDPVVAGDAASFLRLLQRHQLFSKRRRTIHEDYSVLLETDACEKEEISMTTRLYVDTQCVTWHRLLYVTSSTLLAHTDRSTRALWPQHKNPGSWPPIALEP